MDPDLCCCDLECYRCRIFLLLLSVTRWSWCLFWSDPSSPPCYDSRSWSWLTSLTASCLPRVPPCWHTVCLWWESCISWARLCHRSFIRLVSIYLAMDNRWIAKPKYFLDGLVLKTNSKPYLDVIWIALSCRWIAKFLCYLDYIVLYTHGLWITKPKCYLDGIVLTVYE